MKTKILFGVAAAMACAAVCVAGERRSLFNEEDLTGWTAVVDEDVIGECATPEKTWSVVNRAIRTTGSPFGYLRTKRRDFGDFKLHVEYRWWRKTEKPNSGVFVRIEKEHGTFLPTCAENQLCRGAAGDVLGLAGFRFDGAEPRNAFIPTEPLSGISRSPRKGADVEKPFGEWNELEVVLKGDTLVNRLNGVELNHVTGIVPKQGAIALQAEGGAIEFRNVWIEEADDAAKAPTEIAKRAPWNVGAPHFNGPRAFGATPGRVFRHAMPVRGDRKGLVFSVAKGKLPAGVAVDAKTGVLFGKTSEKGRHAFTVRAANACGRAEREMTLVIGDDARGQCPMMGWTSWNTYSFHVTADRVRRTAHALVDTGLAARGYEYVNVDSCWQGARDVVADGAALSANERFPDMKGLVDEIHGLGLKAGIYSSPMTLAWGSTEKRPCLGSRGWPVVGKEVCLKGQGVGAVGHEEADARRWAEWGFDFLKYDWPTCEIDLTETMRKALDATGRDFILLVTTGAQVKWAAEYPKYAQMVRGGRDTWGNWSNLYMLRDFATPWLKDVRPGFWYDMDMTSVGVMSITDTNLEIVDPPAKPNPALMDKFTRDERITQVALFAFLPSPLILSFEVLWADDELLDLVSNEELIDVNQDWPCSAAVLEDLGSGLRRYERKMSDGTKAWLYVNYGETPRTISLKPGAGAASVRDVLAQRDLALKDGAFAFVLQPHASRVFRSR